MSRNACFLTRASTGLIRSQLLGIKHRASQTKDKPRGVHPLIVLGVRGRAGGEDSQEIREFAHKTVDGMVGGVYYGTTQEGIDLEKLLHLRVPIYHL